jgi:hypothetical protein
MQSTDRRDVDRVKELVLRNTRVGGSSAGCSDDIAWLTTIGTGVPGGLPDS